MAIKKSQLYTTLWESCNALRGSMDASQYKDYVLIILFVKYLSDKEGQKGFRLKVPEGCHFRDFKALKQNPNIGEQINVKLEAIREQNSRYIGDLALPNFNDPNKLGSGKTMVDTLSRLIGVFENDALDFSHNRAADDDLLGDAYEYLMKNFAVESGKSKGQFYTPAEVSRVMAKLLRVDQLTRADEAIYDPTCGSGSLLLRALAEASNPRVSIFGQEKDSSTAALAKLNMLLHGISNAQIKVGDTLGEPRFTEFGHTLSTFDVCVANPPFSQKDWLASGMESDPYARWSSRLLPPAKCGDYAFLLHLIASMKPDTGRGACILPHGVLFRGNAEYDIRKHIIEKHYIKGIIGLPPNIFFGTGIPASIIVIDKQGRDERKGIFFIDAKDGFAKDGAKNRLREQDIRRIVDAWDSMMPQDHYCRMATWQEIADNDFNLNIPRYIQPHDNETQHDIHAHLHGGLPAHDICAMQPYWEACPTLKATLFQPQAEGYYRLCVPKHDIATAIGGDTSYKAQADRFASMLRAWAEQMMPEMKAIDQGVQPKKLIELWAGELLNAALLQGGLVDGYEVFDVMMNYWNDTMQDDCYMLANDGWTFPTVRAVKTKVSKDKKTGEAKRSETHCLYDEIVCDLLPVGIILREYFSKETTAIDLLSQRIDNKTSEMATLVEDNMDAFRFSSDDADKEQPNPKEADVKKHVKRAKADGTDKAEQEVWQQWLTLLADRKKLAAELDDKREVLTVAVVEKYAALTEDDIKHLVVERKWLAAVTSSCEALMQNVTHSITTNVTALAERYETTLSQLSHDVARYEDEVNEYLKEMGFEL